MKSNKYITREEFEEQNKKINELISYADYLAKKKNKSIL